MACKPVTLPELLAAREARVRTQEQLLTRHKVPLICFTMNIAGPVKTSPLICRGFRLGCRLLEQQLLRLKAPVLEQRCDEADTGCEAFYAVDLPAEELKEMTVELEEGTALGRLFDLDVLQPDGTKLGRPVERACLICGRPGRACARSRTHGVEELQAKTTELLEQALAEYDRETVGELAVRALLYEVCTTPKPGLVDRSNNGSHRDMDMFTFLSSASALGPYFRRCARIGQETACKAPEETFRALRVPGKLAEGAMLAVTGGVNTHKGAVFTLGILCAALGRLERSMWADPAAMAGQCAAMTRGLVARELAGLTEETARTAGERLYVRYGVTGIRGQLEAGLPAVLHHGLPAMERALARGEGLDAAGSQALLALIAAAEDTNLMARGGVEAQRDAAAEAAGLLARKPDRNCLEALDHRYIACNLSPGGSADLLAVCYLLHFLRDEIGQ